MSNRKTPILIAAALTLLVTFGATAFAQTGETQGQTQTPPAGEHGCKIIEERVRDKIDLFNKLNKSHVQAYNNAQDRIRKYIEKLEKKGFDTSDLKSDLQVFNAKVIKFASDYGAYIKKLAEAKAAACAKAEDARAKIKEAIELLKVVHNDARDLREYYRTEIRPDITSLRKKTLIP